MELMDDIDNLQTILSEYSDYVESDMADTLEELETNTEMKLIKLAVMDVHTEINRVTRELVNLVKDLKNEI